MAFTALDVKKLREMTNVGMMDCKAALTATDGDMDKAVDWLREKGLAKAAKKADRVAAEGVAYATVVGNVGVITRIFFKQFAEIFTFFITNHLADFISFVACGFKQSFTMLHTHFNEIVNKV